MNKDQRNFEYKKNKYNPSDVRFTKVLTKYSTEYNNSLFFQNLCKQLNMDKKDLFSYFMNLKNPDYYLSIEPSGYHFQAKFLNMIKRWMVVLMQIIE